MFKVGDKVKRIKDFSYFPRDRRNQIHTIVSVRESGSIEFGWSEGYAYDDTCFINAELLKTSKERASVSDRASDTQVGGTHYTSMGIQPFEFTYANYGYMGLKAAVHTKVNKYLGRVKDNEIEQLKKAKHCIEVLIEKAELEEEKGK